MEAWLGNISNVERKLTSARRHTHAKDEISIRVRICYSITVISSIVVVDWISVIWFVHFAHYMTIQSELRIKKLSEQTAHNNCISIIGYCVSTIRPTITYLIDIDRACSPLEHTSTEHCSWSSISLVPRAWLKWPRDMNDILMLYWWGANITIVIIHNMVKWQ